MQSISAEDLFYIIQHPSSPKMNFIYYIARTEKRGGIVSVDLYYKSIMQHRIDMRYLEEMSSEPGFIEFVRPKTQIYPKPGYDLFPYLGYYGPANPVITFS